LESAVVQKFAHTHVLVAEHGLLGSAWVDWLWGQNALARHALLCAPDDLIAEMRD